ncbi:Chromosome partitioning protein parB [Bifidobacterium coryneforme]|nr:Chromosome partitioning protein parB [Bifidobacterium coryneforme]
MASRSRLGKGLGALFPALPGEDSSDQATGSEDSAAQEASKAKSAPAHSGTRKRVGAKPTTADSAASASAGTKSSSSGLSSTKSSTAKASAGSGTKKSSRKSAASTTKTDGKSGSKGKITRTSQAQGKTSAKKAKSSTSGAGDSAGAEGAQTRQESPTGTAKPKSVSRRTSASGGRKSISKMPDLDSLKHPSDLFFGSTVTGVSRETYREMSSASEAGDESQKSLAHSATRPAQEKAVESGKAVRDAVSDHDLKPVQGGYLMELRTDEIGPNAQQPRHIFDEDELLELSRSIQEVGVLQPIVVRKIAKGGSQEPYKASASEKSVDQPVEKKTGALAGKTAGSENQGPTYEIIMGERRWRATQLAGLETIPAIVKTTADDAMLRDALLENLHRVALNPLEEAAAYQQMIDEFGLTQEGLSKSVSKSRPQITNTLRLLKLPPSVQKKVSSGVLSAGHARALLTLPTEDDMNALANKIIAEGLSVRSTEELVALKTGQVKQKARKSRPDIWSDSPVRQNLESRFDTKVAIKGTKKHGRIEIVFSSPEDMDRILTMLLDGGQNGMGPSDKADGWV